MKRNIFILSFIILNLFVNAQEGYSVDSLEHNIIKIEDYTKISEPFYSLSKIKKIVKKLEFGDKQEENTLPLLSENEFNKLSLKEKYTYTMLYPEEKAESISYNITDQDNKKVILGYLPEGWNHKKWSTRQQEFLQNNKKEIVNMIKESSQKTQFIGVNYKIALEALNAVETIPFLISIYKKNKDNSILTLLMTFARKNNYYPFLRSNVYNDLFSKGKSEQNSYLEYTQKMEDYILKTGQNFYKNYKVNNMIFK